MTFMLIVRLIEIALGILVNIFIGKIVMFLFKKDGTLPRTPVRIAGVWLLINGLSWIIDNHIL